MGPWKLKQNSRGPGISPGKTQTRVGISHTSSMPRLNYTWGMLRNQNTVKYSKVLLRFFLIFKHCSYGFHFTEIFANAKIIDTMKKVKVFSKIFFLKEDV